jgi:hypothetical protein
VDQGNQRTLSQLLDIYIYLVEGAGKLIHEKTEVENLVAPPPLSSSSNTFVALHVEHYQPTVQ